MKYTQERSEMWRRVLEKLGILGDEESMTAIELLESFGYQVTLGSETIPLPHSIRLVSEREDGWLEEILLNYVEVVDEES